MSLKKNNYIKSFSERFTQLVHGSSMTQVELASKLGVAQSSVNNYKNGKSEPKSHELYKIAATFNVSLEWLLTGKESNRLSDIGFWRDRALKAEKDLHQTKELLKDTIKILQKAVDT